ncbi:hypothetical protein RZS08_11705, partial [Arthrospira platensis SPKY1]|nr:hypothetical protein [Arthrospira platensis SPKY1]
PQAWQGLDHPIEPLAAAEPAHRQEQFLLRPEAQALAQIGGGMARMKPRQIHAGVNDPNPFFRNPQLQQLALPKNFR